MQIRFEKLSVETCGAGARTKPLHCVVQVRVWIRPALVGTLLFLELMRFSTLPDFRSVGTVSKGSSGLRMFSASAFLLSWVFGGKRVNPILVVELEEPDRSFTCPSFHQHFCESSTAG